MNQSKTLSFKAELQGDGLEAIVKQLSELTVLLEQVNSLIAKLSSQKIDLKIKVDL